jgi:hypothetical protein
VYTERKFDGGSQVKTRKGLLIHRAATLKMAFKKLVGLDRLSLQEAIEKFKQLKMQESTILHWQRMYLQMISDIVVEDPEN